jgi:type I restriction enzyme M protein
VLKEHAAKKAAGIAFEPFVKRVTGLDFYNVSSLDMGKLMGDQDNIRANLDSYIQGFAPDVRSIFEHFDFATTVERLHKAKLLYLVTEKFAGFRPAPGRGRQRADGPGVRGADPQVRRTLERDGR